MPSPNPEPTPEKLAEALRDSLREESTFWAQVQEMGPKLRMLALAIFLLAVLFFVGFWVLQSSVEGQKAIRERQEARP